MELTALDKFKAEFKQKFPTSSIDILEEVGNNKSYVIARTEFGFCKVRKQHLLAGVSSTIQCAVDKNLYYSNKANAIHNFEYNYNLANYTSSVKKITIICKKHGQFDQLPNAHLKGQGCPKCKNLKISKKKSECHTGWTLTNWINASKKSKKFESFKVYIIQCWNSNEAFFKIGRTFASVKKRFISKTEMPYFYTIVKIFEGSAEEMYKLETDLKRINKDDKYHPILTFNGSNECFKKVTYNE
jgi:hypothetical protein